MDDINDIKTQLLTLLNVSASKRQISNVEEMAILEPTTRKKKKSLSPPPEPTEAINGKNDEQPLQDDEDEVHSEHEQDGEYTYYAPGLLLSVLIAHETIYQKHFGPEAKLLSDNIREAVNQNKWKNSSLKRGKLGVTLSCIPESSQDHAEEGVSIVEKLRSAYDSRANKLSPTHNELRTDILNTLSRYQDLFIARTELENNTITRDAITLHALNHIFKTELNDHSIRRRVLKNNERIAAHSQKDLNADPPPDIQDQGFTRPSVLILLPFRSSAQRWGEALLSHLPNHQVENRSRFMSEFTLPSGTVDKLATAEPGTYPADHVDTFKGNVDDNFRVGVKITKKAVKFFSGFYQSDAILASPLGLRLIIERDKNADFLSSVEVLIMDQIDALTMQNWDHVIFILERLNQVPKEAHDADFSRIKPWYLDGHASYLRQSILLSPYETPEIRAVFNRHCKNIAGKLRTECFWKPVNVPEGVEQKFLQFECVSHVQEPDKRFEYFTTQVLPPILKSAVQSTNLLIFIPSSFDFIRIQNYFRKLPDLSDAVAVLSEYIYYL
ncbi:hypothetical protein Clacol_000392 [Clathrus columnatus]|uniref:U3 small nucleolar RNA-associated protein 25 n=1 Tax=Clathrus columnatus TaxID=1419009 RepID=A0AAV4ZZ71_9AGAM|nr:hypothetical protein Clacol_000392 [Clathrus columnatus]